LVLFAGQSAYTDRGTVRSPEVVTKTMIVPVEGMSCPVCAARVKRSLAGIAGVSDVEVSLVQRTARIRYDPRRLSVERLVAAIQGLGYQAGVPAGAE